MVNVIPFNFGQYPVRVLEKEGDLWFVASDVAKALVYAEAKDMTRHLDEDEKGRQIVPTPGGEQEMLVISESGLYTAIIRSRKPEAKPFKKWLTATVLPSIRKTGRYEHPNALPRSPAQDGLFEFQFKGKRFRILFASGQLMYSSEDAMQILGRAGEPSESAFIRKMAKQQDAWHALIPNTQQHLPVFSELAFMELLNTASHQTANDLLVWLNDEVRPVLYTGQTAGLSQQPNPEQSLRAVLEGKRFICTFDHEQRLTLRELTQEERILTPEKLPQWIADPFGAPFSCLPEVLRAATERLISGRRRPGE